MLGSFGKRGVGIAFMASILGSLVGCSADTGTVPTGECPRGQILQRGECVERSGGTGDPVDPRDTGSLPGTPDAGAGSDTTDPADGSGESDVDLGTICEPGSTGCLDAVTRFECAPDGLSRTPTPCGPAEVCTDGECVGAEVVCDPGTVVACEDERTQRLCDDAGAGFVTRPCPEVAPNCLGEGFCSDDLCIPRTRACDGDNATVCNEEGDAFETTQICQFGCQSGACVDPCATTGKDYLGCTFYAVDLPNVADAADTDFAITISNTFSAEVEAEIVSPDGTERMVTIPANSLELVSLGVESLTDSSLNNRSFRVTSSAPVTIHQFNPINSPGVATNDASLLLPATSVGTEYIVTAWPVTTFPNGAFSRGYTTIVAVNSGTTNVTVTPSAPVGAGSGVPALIAGQTETFALEQGQVLNLMTTGAAAADLTGTEISSDKPVAVFAGHECGNVPLNTQFCDHMEQQLLPTDTWSTQFVGAKFRPRGREADVYRIVGRESGTTLTMEPANVLVHNRTIGRGEVVEFTETRDFVLTASQPVSMSQFMVGSLYPGEPTCYQTSFGTLVRSGCAIDSNASCGQSAIGDPAFLVNVPTDQFLSDYIVLTPSQYQEDYLTIIAPSGATIRLDGTPISAGRSSLGGWDIIRIPVADGVHRVDADVAFGLYAYGYDCDVSYAYPGGLNLDSL